MSNALTIGAAVEIQKHFEMDTGADTGVDEVTYCVGRVIALDTKYADVELLNGQEINISLRRLRVIR
jgi:hypothetical protein